MTLYVLSYNNYFNRKVMVLSDIAACEPYVKQKIEHVSFNPNDGVTASQIVNSYSEGDYLVCSEDDKTIESRWFILEADRTRQGQYNLQLKRDSIADNLEAVKSAPLFVEKAMLEDDDPMIVNDEGMQTNKVKIREILLKDASKVPWIVGYISKKQGDKTIKVSEDAAYEEVLSLGELEAATGISADVLSSHLSKDDEERSPLYVTKNIKFYYGLKKVSSMWRCRLDMTGEIVCSGFDSITNSEFEDQPMVKSSSENESSITINQQLKDAINENRDSIRSSMSSLKRGYYVSSDQMAELAKYAGKKIEYLDNVYTLRLINNGEPVAEDKAEGVITAFKGFNAAFKTAALPSSCEYLSTGKVRLNYVDDVYNIVLESVSDYEITTNIPSTRRTLQKEVFDMFCMPAEDIGIVDKDAIHICYGDIQRKMASAIRTELDANCYDIQLLPYCPIPNIISNGRINIVDQTINKDYEWINPATEQTRTGWDFFDSSSLEWKVSSYVEPTVSFRATAYYQLPDKYYNNATVSLGSITSRSGNIQITASQITADTSKNSYLITLSFTITGEMSAATMLKLGDLQFKIKAVYHITHAGVILWASKNSFNVSIDQNLSIEHSMKIDSNCCSWRLCSPNYQGSFEFNVAKNGGAVNGFRADCTYKPYNPYIRVYPNFSWLYGTDFGDGRGLICGGDFSLPQVSDAWASYQLQNKNYQNTFNREIQSLDYSNKLQMRNQIIGSITGAIGDTTRGVGSGKAFGLGGVGAGVMGAIAGAASLAGGIADTVTLAQQQKESRQLSIDKFSYQLGNIQALPYTISKVGTFDINSKVFPFLEFYDCTDQELEAFENKIKYESMTVMRIGTLEEFKKTDMSYIKGSLIRLDGIGGDTRLLNDIYSELYKGVFY